MKKSILFFTLLVGVLVGAQQIRKGKVVDKDTQTPIANVLVEVPGTPEKTFTNAEGEFELNITTPSPRFRFSHEDYNLLYASPDSDSFWTVEMEALAREIEEVQMSTGYQSIPKERATGAFTFIDAEQLHHQVDNNILNRLPAIANGITFATGLSEKPQLMVRGLSTIQGPKMPLIVLDNFPYEGDIEDINPDMVQSITILKDAAASSIWGARAANGVIVITTKKPLKNRPFSVDISSLISMSPKPDLFYAKQMSSQDFIEVETKLFENGYYDSSLNSKNHPTQTPVVTLLYKDKMGEISHQEAALEIERLKKVDVRDQYLKYMYQPMLNQKYSVNMMGGTENYSFSGFLGYNDHQGNLYERSSRINAKINNSWKIGANITALLELYLNRSKDKSGRSAYNSISPSGVWKIPYLEFADEKGNPLILPKAFDQDFKNSLQGRGLLDWNYYPLNDWAHTRSSSEVNEALINTGINYKVYSGIAVDLKYQYQRSQGSSGTLYDAESYYARDYVNGFAQNTPSGQVNFIVPVGGILSRSNSTLQVNNLRGQLSFDKKFAAHEVHAIIGVELREAETEYESNRYYGYNKEDRSVAIMDYVNQYPHYITGSLDRIQKISSLRTLNTRFLSEFANAAYIYKGKYTLSASVRRDGSNLFGVKTNDQWNPFWSSGVAWNIGKEEFYKNEFFPHLNLRASYGFNGNIDPSMVAVTTIAYQPSLSLVTGSKLARIDNFYNASLRWETLRMINIGIDFASKGNRIAGSVDFFMKKGDNLFGQAPLDYTTGVSSMLWNVAGLKGQGFDVELRTQNIKHPFAWNSLINFSTFKDKITDYYLPTTFARDFISQPGATPRISGIVGKPVYAMYAYHWAGLNPENGNPQGYLQGEISEDYAAIMGADQGVETLKYFGSAIPTYFGSWVNTFQYHNLRLDIGITYKLGYWVRRNSINYTRLYSSRDGHSDYALRWQKPGDEERTSVPSNLYVSNSSRDQFYLGAEPLVEKGDHIRLQYIRLAYTPRLKTEGAKLKGLELSLSVDNLGILWRANKSGIDPDYNWGTYTIRPQEIYSLGLNIKF